MRISQHDDTGNKQVHDGPLIILSELAEYVHAIVNSLGYIFDYKMNEFL